MYTDRELLHKIIDTQFCGRHIEYVQDDDACIQLRAYDSEGLYRVFTFYLKHAGAVTVVVFTGDTCEFYKMCSNVIDVSNAFVEFLQ